MTTNATPRDLDPKFKDATVPADAEKVEAKPEVKDETPDARLRRMQSTEIAKDPNEGFITHTQPYVASDGTVGTKVHGPMPVSEWAAYSRENGL